MTAFPKVTALEVWLASAGADIIVGHLAWSGPSRRAIFEYDRAFLETGHDLFPLVGHARGSIGPLAAPREPFDGLHGLFADSLPDGWGRRLVDRQLGLAGIDHRSLSPIDRLALVGSRGIGALSYRPGIALGTVPGGYDQPNAETTMAMLDAIAGAVRSVESDDASAHSLDRLYRLNGNSAGARPKAFVEITDARGHAESWLIKFPAATDDPSIGAIEAAYAAMAGEAGVTMAETRLFPSGLKNPALPGYFGARRFDRGPDSAGLATRHLLHTAAGLVHADHRLPELSYESLLTITRRLTRDQAAVIEQYRRAVFNVLAGNRDDHARNHAFLYDVPSKLWRMAPAYDLTPSEGAGGEHAASVNGKGRQIAIGDLLALAAQGRIETADAVAIIEATQKAISGWARLAAACRVPKAAADRVALMLKQRGEDLDAGKPAPGRRPVAGSPSKGSGKGYGD